MSTNVEGQTESPNSEKPMLDAVSAKSEVARRLVVEDLEGTLNYFFKIEPKMKDGPSVSNLLMQAIANLQRGAYGR